MSVEHIKQVVDEFNKNSKEKMERENKKYLDSFITNNREEEYQKYTNEQFEISDEERNKIMDAINALDNVYLANSLTEKLSNKADN